MTRIGFSLPEAILYDRYQAESVLVPVAPHLGELAGALPPAARLLDVGCGGGHALISLRAQRPDLAAVGVDISWPQIKAARRRLGSTFPVALIRGSATGAPFRDGTFDAVIALFSVKHWPDRGEGLAECARVLKPGGKLLVAEIDGDATFNEWRRWVSTGCLAPVVRQAFSVGAYFAVVRSSVTVGSMGDLLRAAGFDDVAVGRVPGFPVVLATARVPT